MRIAVIGSGIAGNAAAWALATGSPHEIVVYEQDGRIGGHSATVDIDYDGVTIPVDTGFIVYNELNYPNMTALFAHLGVRTEASDMGFAVSSNAGALEWAGRATNMLDGLFARRRNLVSPSHINMIREMFRFNKAALADRAAGRLTSESIGAYLDRGGYSRRFREEYLIPMGAAIWSMPPRSLVEFPADSFIAFFDNHRLLHWNRPTWRTVSGGSREYVKILTAPFADRIRLNTPVASIRRHDLGVTVTDASGHGERFDQVIIAAHSDQALAMLSDASAEERSVLAGIPYRGNDVWLHRDPALMPKRKAAWAAWNVIQGDDGAEITLTYWMNALQNIDKRKPVFVTLNPPAPPRADLTFGRFHYAHPQYRTGATAAQAALPGIQGRSKVWFCGAWTGYGFHEDGLTSGLNVAETLGAVVPWRVAERRFAAAAE
jgi:predicted NAD/FAD-binding protein